MVSRSDGPWYVSRAERAAPSPDVRIGDAERNQMTEALSQHYSDGRLDSTELKERLERTVNAKTRGDLAGLLADLPPLTHEAPPPPRRRRVALWAVLVLVAAALLSPWQHGPGPWVPHFPWFVFAIVALFVWSRARRHHRVPPG